MDQSWKDDLVWVKANQSKGHISTPQSEGKLFRIFDGFGFVEPSQLFTQMFYGNPTASTVEMAGFACRFSTRDPKKLRMHDVCMMRVGRRKG